MQNKANFRKVKLNVNKVLTKDYEQMDTWSIRKTKPIQSQLKPIQTQTNLIKAKTNPNKPKQTQFPNFPKKYFLIAISGKNKYAHENDAQRYETV